MEILSTIKHKIFPFIRNWSPNAALSIAGAIRGTSREKFYHELGFESLVSRRWYLKLCCSYKVFETQSPRYLFDVIPTAKKAYITKNNDKLPHFKVKHNYLKILSFLRLRLNGINWV